MTAFSLAQAGFYISLHRLGWLGLYGRCLSKLGLQKLGLRRLGLQKNDT